MDGIVTFENTIVFLDFSRCSASLAKERVKTKLRRLAPTAELNAVEHCVIVLTKQEGQIFEDGSFEEFGKQAAHARSTRERPDETPTRPTR